MLKGDLASFSLGELLQSLSVNNHTGTLKISVARNRSYYIYFVNGDVRAVSRGRPEEPPIGDVLVRLGKITAKQHRDAQTEKEETGLSVGIALLQSGLVDKQDVIHALRIRLAEQLYELFQLTRGEFEFRIGEFPEEHFDELQRSAPVTISTNSIIMEGLRRIDEWKLIRARLPSFDIILVRTEVEAPELNELSQQLLAKVDGRKTISDFFEGSFGTEFEVCKQLIEFWDAELIRPMSCRDCLEEASICRDNSDPKQAAKYLRYATGLVPDDPNLWLQLSQAYSSLREDELARKALIRATRIHFETGNLEKGAAIGERLISDLSRLDESDLEILFQTFLRVGKPKILLAVGSHLSTLLQKKGRFTKAAEVVKALAESHPGEINLRIQVALLYQKADKIDLAVKCFQGIAAELQKSERYRELLRVLRLLQPIHPKEAEIKTSIQKVQSLLVQMEKRRKRRITLAGAIIILLVSIAVLPIMYEVNSWEQFNDAMRLEQIGLLTKDYVKAIHAYEQFIEDYGFSSKVAEAEVAISRLRVLQGTKAIEAKASDVRAQKRQEQKLRELEDLNELLTHAQEAEENGELKRAHKIFRQAIEKHRSLPQVRSITLPLRVTSDPPRAQLRITSAGGQATSVTTPHIVRYRPGEELSFHITRRGCVSQKKSLVLKDRWKLHFKLDRRPIAEFVPALGIHQPLAMAGDHLLITARDGKLHAVHPVTTKPLWGRPRTVGRFGDKTSPITVAGREAFLGTVTGEVTALSVATGESRWVVRTDGPILAAPAVSENKRWVAVGTYKGNVHLIDNAKGKLARTFKTENSVSTPPAFAGNQLLAGSTDNSFYAFSLSSGGAAFVKNLSDDVVAGPVLRGQAAYVGTRDGRIYRVRLPQGEVAASVSLDAAPTQILSVGRHVLVSTAAGELVNLDPQGTAKLWTLKCGSTPLRGSIHKQEYFYGVTEAGKLSVISIADRKVLWRVATGRTAVVSPLVTRDALFVANASGRVLVFEVLE